MCLQHTGGALPHRERAETKRSAEAASMSHRPRLLPSWCCNRRGAMLQLPAARSCSTLWHAHDSTHMHRWQGVDRHGITSRSAYDELGIRRRTSASLWPWQAAAGAVGFAADARRQLRSARCCRPSLTRRPAPALAWAGTVCDLLPDARWRGEPKSYVRCPTYGHHSPGVSAGLAGRKGGEHCRQRCRTASMHALGMLQRMVTCGVWVTRSLRRCGSRQCLVQPLTTRKQDDGQTTIDRRPCKVLQDLSIRQHSKLSASNCIVGY